MQTLLGLLYTLVTPVVKFRLGLEAADSGTCKEKLLLYFFQGRRDFHYCLGCFLTGKITGAWIRTAEVSWQLMDTLIQMQRL